MKKAITILLACVNLAILAQNYTVSGYVRDADTGEDLIGANVYFKETMVGTGTNNYGFYSLQGQKGSYTVAVSYMGYNNYSLPVVLDKNKKLNIELTPQSIETGEVTVSAQGIDKNVTSIRMSTVEMQIQSIKDLPQLMGEVDILKTIQLLPGVQSSGEGNSGFYVRGGGPDQNLILLDEAVVYNASHLFGFFSVFNADAVKNINLIKGGMPANYGGRLSSVLDISMKEGNMKELHGEGGIGVISSRLTLEGPIVKDKSSFIVSGRRTYIDLLIKPFVKETSRFKGSGYHFYDLNAKFNYRFSDKDRLFVSGYFGRDVFSLNSKDAGLVAEIPWGNATVSARWNHLFSSKLFLNTTAVYSDYDFSFGAELEDFEIKLLSGIKDIHLKTDLTWLPNPKHTVKFGASYTNHVFLPGSFSAQIGTTVVEQGDASEMYAHEGAIYVNDEWKITDILSVNLGLRGTGFMQIGPFNRYLHDNFGVVTDTVNYADGERIVDYRFIEPRFSTRLLLNESTSLKASFTQNYQYIHMATISSVSLPTDLWVPSSSLVKPQMGVQYAAGIFKNFANNKYEASIEAYYKHLDNQIEYRDGATPGGDIGDNPDNSFEFGWGESYGVEFFLKKAVGDLSGWVGYTWSKTNRTFENINEGISFPAKYDRRHDLSVIASYKFSEHWSASAVFVYATGNAMTLPSSRYFIDGNIVNEYVQRNSMRMTNYHRADISATYKLKKGKFFDSSLNLSVYNVYNRKNPYFIYFDNEGSIIDGDFTTTAKQVSLFPALPSISWNFSF